MSIKQTISFCPLDSYENLDLMLQSLFGTSKSEVKKVISNKNLLKKKSMPEKKFNYQLI